MSKSLPKEQQQLAGRSRRGAGLLFLEVPGPVAGFPLKLHPCQKNLIETNRRMSFSSEIIP